MVASVGFSLEKTETEAYQVKLKCARELEYAFIWQPGEVYAIDDYVRPTRTNGFAYKATTAGQSTNNEPKWPKSLATTKTDGSITWQTVAVDTNSSDSIASVNIADVTGITIGTAAISGTDVLFDVSGGTDARHYEISVEITTSAGNVIERTLTVSIVGE